MRKEEDYIGQITFFGKNGILFKMGDDGYATGRRETFHIADNERLIGGEFDHGANYLMGVTFLKWTI